ncbi:MAG: RtcB family protein [Desulfovibrionaceae bacterium]|nr:RtcB family protein [Desulfovibrionaceae bacterium]
MPAKKTAPWRQWGHADMDEAAIQQMRNACLLPNAVYGALMPDAHVGYGLPIGGVLAIDNAVIPYAVGVDIACRMRLSVLDMPPEALKERRDAFAAALQTQTRFGVGKGFAVHERREHQVMDEDWSMLKKAGVNKDKAWEQLGSSGAGNHFVEFGELHLPRTARLGGLKLEAGAYLALLSHSGSRGSGEAAATYYSRLAMSLHPSLPQELRHLAWLELDSEPGQEYWEVMQLMGRYAAANHELIHRHVLSQLGAEPLTHVENHHNFAWKEEHHGRKVVVHRKGATPAGAGVQGIIPGSMASPGFVVQGLGNSASIHSCSHGAGRRMSRGEALRTLSRESMLALLKANRVELLSGGLDESPAAYKDINEVMRVQADLVEILARFEPRLVKMAPDDSARRQSKKR